MSGISYNDTMVPSTIIPAFDSFLADRQQRFAAVVIGAAALVLSGIVSRNTRDCDVLCPPIEPAIALLAVEFATIRRGQGFVLRDDWLNNGPSSLTTVLPIGWTDRLVPLYTGRAICFTTLGRNDLLCTKLFALFALCDRASDFEDCLAFKPTDEELNRAIPWLEIQDLNPDWPGHVRKIMERLRKAAHGI